MLEKLKTIIFFVLCSLLIWAPIPLASNRIWSWTLLCGAIYLLTALYAVLCLVKNKPLVSANWHWLVLAPLATFASYQFLQWLSLVPGISTLDPYQTQTLLLKSLAYFSFCWLLLQLTDNARQVKWVLIAIVISGVFQATYGTTINLLGLSHSPIFGYPEVGRARGSFVYQNHFANFLAIATAIALGWLVSELKTDKSSWTFKDASIAFVDALLSKKAFLRLAIVIIVIGLILSRSRMGNSGFFIALLFTGLIALLFYKKPPALLKPLLLSIVVLDILIVGSIFGLEKLKQRFEDTSFASETRDEVVIDSIPIIHDHWLTGTGAGTFYTVFPNYQPAPYFGFYDHAHNEYVQFSIEYGVPVTLLLGAWIVWLLILNVQTMRIRDNKLMKGLAFGCFMAISHMLIHNTVDFNLQSPANILLFVTVLTLSVIANKLPNEKHQRALQYR